MQYLSRECGLYKLSVLLLLDHVCEKSDAVPAHHQLGNQKDLILVHTVQLVLSEVFRKLTLQKYKKSIHNER